MSLLFDLMNQSRKITFVFLGMAVSASFFAITALAFEAPRYDLSVHIDTSAKKIEAREIVTFTNNSPKPLKEIYFHVYANRRFTKQEKDFMFDYAGYFKMNPFPDGFQSPRLEIKTVSFAEAPLTFAFEGEDQTLLKVDLGKPLAFGESVILKMDFSLQLPHALGRLGWHDDVFALAHWYPALCVLTDEGWNKNPFYPFHRPFYQEAAFFRAAVTLPKDYTVIHSGVLEKEESDGKTKTLTIGTPLPLRDFTMALSRRYQMIEGRCQEAVMRSFYLPRNEKKAEEALQIACETFAFYGKKFTPYPYPVFNIAPVYLGYGGEQMSNLIFIDTRAYGLPGALKRQFDFLISHETGHQWFYNLVGVDEFKEMWLEEGVNSYFNLEYLENKYGKDAAVLVWPKSLEWLLPNFSFRRARDYRYKLMMRTSWDYPVSSALSSYREPSEIFSVTYGKGSAITSMLKYLMGEEAFGRVFKRIFDEYRFKNLSADDLKRLCKEEASGRGQDLEKFFSDWLLTKGRLDYAIAGRGRREIWIENRGDIAMPLAFNIEYLDGKSEYQRLEAPALGPGERRKVALCGAAGRVILDPKAELLDSDRTNNFYPRHLRLIPVWFWTPLYDVPLFLPEDSYNLTVGPSAAEGLGVTATLQKPYDYHVYGAAHWEFNDQRLTSRAGYRLNHIFASPFSTGFEFFNTTDYDDGEDDLAGGKFYLRKELRPAAHSLANINDHAMLYVIRNRSLNKAFSPEGAQDARNVSYLKRDEAIVGGSLHLSHAGPFPEVRQGFQANGLLEHSGHFLGATQYFYRGAVDLSFYRPLSLKTTLALRLKYGWGYPDDKNLYELGGADGLRGYDRKTLRGAHMGLGSLEWRFPLVKGINASFFDNLLRLEDIGGVIFVDAGQSWFGDIDETTLKKDAGLGLRFSFAVASFLEKVILRVDAAQAISEDDEDPKVWVGVNHAF